VKYSWIMSNLFEPTCVSLYIGIPWTPPPHQAHHLLKPYQFTLIYRLCIYLCTCLNIYWFAYLVLGTSRLTLIFTHLSRSTLSQQVHSLIPSQIQIHSICASFSTVFWSLTRSIIIRWCLPRYLLPYSRSRLSRMTSTMCPLLLHLSVTCQTPH